VPYFENPLSPNISYPKINEDSAHSTQANCTPFMFPALLDYYHCFRIIIIIIIININIIFFFIDIILPIALCPWGRLSLYKKREPAEVPEVKDGRCVMFTNIPLSCAVVMKSGNIKFLEPSGPFQACNGTALPLLFMVPISLFAAFVLL
jgi:hypothetical protein